MIGTLSRVFTRKFLPTFCKATVGSIRFEPMYFAGNFVSSSCVNHRRVLYDNTNTKNTNKKLMSDDEDEDEYLSEDEDDDILPENINNTKKKPLKYYSDGEDSENADADYNNINVSYVTLPKGSKAVRNELFKCSLSSLKAEKKCIVKELRRVKYIMQKGIIPTKIFFTQVSDIIDLNRKVDTVQLYKLHWTDIPIGMQNKRRQAFFAIFNVEDISKMVPDATPKNLMPVTIICNGIENQKIIINILTAAAVCNTSHILFTTDIGHVFHNYTVHSIFAHNAINLELSQPWISIEKRIGDEASVFVLLIRKPRENENDIPLADLTEIDFWKKKEVVLVITEYLEGSVLEFCTEKSAKVITVKEANRLFYRFMSLGATTFTILSQYKQKVKAKSDTKKKKRGNSPAFPLAPDS